MKPDIVLYHSACLDGFTGAYACYLKYPNDHEIKYIPLTHYQEYTEEFISQFRQKNVILIDISTPLTITQKILEIADNLLIIDHHITAQKDLDLIDEKNKIFDMTKSGCVLAYQYFFPENKVPLEFLYIQDRDIWIWKYEKESKPFTNALFAKVDLKNIKNHYQKFEEYHQIFNQREELITYGNILLEFQTKIVKSQVEQHQKVKFKNPLFHHFKGAIVNSSLYSSEIGNYLTSNSGYDFAIIYLHQFKNNLNNWYCSIRSNTDECDVSLIAKHYQGGGHKRASGFTIEGDLMELFEFI